MNITEYQNYHETKTHTSAEFPYNTYLCSIPLDFKHVPLHWHEEVELIVIKKGSGSVSVNFRQETVTAGDIILILPGQLHAIQQKPGFAMEYENIIFKQEILVTDSRDLCTQQFLLPFFHSDSPYATFISQLYPGYTGLSSCIIQIDNLCRTKPRGYQLAVKGWLFQFFYLLISSQNSRDYVPLVRTKSLEKLKTVLKYVEDHYGEPISIDDMAALTYYSKSHFMKFFKTHMQTGFTQYLNDYRLSMAARLLTATESPVLEIAALTGFDNLSYFNRVFKRKYRVTPTQYRKASAP